MCIKLISKQGHHHLFFDVDCVTISGKFLLFQDAVEIHQINLRKYKYFYIMEDNS